MKKIIICITALIVISCNSKNKVSSKEEKNFAIAQETFIDTLNMIYADTSNLSTSPLVIINAEIGKKNSVLESPITFTVKNIGEKDIEAVKFRMIVKDAFGEVVYELFDTAFQYGEVRIDDVIKAGQIKKFTENLDYIGEPKKVAKCFPYEIAFTDGKIWTASGQ